MRDQIPKKNAHEFVVACFLEKYQQISGHLAFAFQNQIVRNPVVEIKQLTSDMTSEKDILVLFQVVVTHKRFVVPDTAEKHPDVRHQKCAFLLACSDFQIVQIIAMAEEIAKSSLMD